MIGRDGYMIPKKIHYCWFGREEKPLIVKKCIESWKNILVDYEIKEWNEDNFDININEFVRQAYESGKYAFVSDYVRVYALYNYGGIYMDTDVEVYKAFSLDRVRIHPKTESLIEAIKNDDLYYVSNNMKNLLENVTLRKHNILIKIKEDMNRCGAVGSMMSGSGPSVFAFFDDMLKAQKCYEKMKENHREVFLTRTI